MVTRILLDPRRDLPGGAGFTSDPIVLEATPTGIREDGSIFVLPSTLSFTVNTAADVVQLPPPAASWAWRLVARQDGVPAQQRTVRFPDVPSISYADLTDVDPASLGETRGHARQWDATFFQLVTLIGQLQDEVAALTAGAPGAFDTFLEVATRMGLDETSITALQGLVAGKANAADLVGYATTASVAATYAPLLPATSTKIAAYTSAGNEIVPVDATAAAVTVTLPNAPADKTRVIVKKIDASTHAVTIATAGSDVLNKVGGSVSAALALPNQGATLQYASASQVWLVVASDVPLSQLDLRYGSSAQPGYDIVVLAGQSNMEGASEQVTSLNSTLTDVVNPLIDQWGTIGTLGLKPAVEPLDGYSTVPRGIGPGLQFARWYAGQYLPSTPRKVLLVQTAKGGTPFEGASSPAGFAWKIGRSDVTNLYTNMVSRVRAAKAAADAVAGTTNRIVAFLWLQGESDGDNGTTATTYRTDLDALLTQMRSDFGVTDLPILIGTMVPEYLTSGNRAAINAVHRNTPARLTKTDIAVGATGLNMGDGNHYNAAGQRLNGRAFFDAFQRVKQGLAPTYTDYTVGTTTGVIAVSGSSTSLAVTWAVTTNAASYFVEYRLTGASTWTSGPVTSTPSVVIPGLTTSTSYDVRVTPRNVFGDVGTPSVVVTGTPTPPAVSDSFTRANTTSGLGVADSGQTWVAGTGTYGITSNTAYPVSGADGDRVTIETAKTDQTVTVTVTGITPVTSGPNISVMARMTDANNGYLVNMLVSGGSARIFKIVNGTYTALGVNATGITFAEGTTITLAVSGSTLTAYVNGALVATTTDTTFTAGTKAGLRIGGASSTVRYDNFIVG